MFYAGDQKQKRQKEVFNLGQENESILDKRHIQEVARKIGLELKEESTSVS